MLEDTDKHIEVAGGYHITAKQKGQVWIRMCDNNRDPFIAMLYNVLLALDLCDGLFSIITLIKLGHPYFSTKKIHGVLWSTRDKCGYITTYCTKETCILGGNQVNVKNKEISI